jgi:hypothetical protein
MPPGFLDYKGRELRDRLDLCLAQNMWFFSIGGILITIPICVKYKVGLLRMDGCACDGGGWVRRGSRFAVCRRRRT